MKRLYAVLAAVTLAGAAGAASVNFDFGTNFFTPNNPGALTQNGTNFLISWNIENDIALGTYTELSLLNGGGYGVGDTLSVAALQVTKGVVKGVRVGLNLGAGTESTGPTTATLVDVLGAVDILSGAGDKVEGRLTATVAARFNKLPGAPANLDGYNVGLSVGIGF
jgi:hypothetical protein